MLPCPPPPPLPLTSQGIDHNHNSLFGHNTTGWPISRVLDLHGPVAASIQCPVEYTRTRTRGSGTDLEEARGVHFGRNAVMPSANENHRLETPPSPGLRSAPENCTTRPVCQRYAEHVQPLWARCCLWPGRTVRGGPAPNGHTAQKNQNRRGWAMKCNTKTSRKMGRRLETESTRRRSGAWGEERKGLMKRRTPRPEL